ncbi:calcium-transporting ATPase 5, plasma membrane-type-like isoform X4 [Musa acuminata AAA Group]|uniref:calcium-transporting ATPase 5, plasma membrane-type-like isoform X4 n=1 Tax=Musa acuminata AAA Group TaxID=214697 RepID=UPI0031DD5987
MDLRRRDEEWGGSGGDGRSETNRRSSSSSAPGAFDIPPKNAPVARLRRWRKAALVLNASRRFRYTLDLKKREEKEQLRRKIRLHAQVIRAALLFKDGGVKGTPGAPGGSALPNGGFGIGEEQLTTMMRDHNFSAIEEGGGVKGLANLLKTDLDRGISGVDMEVLCRRKIFGANTYPRKKGRSFWVFLWESWQDLTLVILMIAAVLSLVLGIKTEGIKEGWYDGGSIAFAVILVVIVTAVSDYRQSLQFQNLNEEKQNIHMEVIRSGRRIKVSIFDIVVGDVVPLKIGDQVPADGILITGHSLAIDESSMTGESKIVHKDQKAPFLMSGCKVADGYGNMLVTAVGINTEWGLLMSSISEDTGEETPLQVRLNGVATFIGIAGLTVAAAVLLVLLARYFTGHTKNPNGSVQFAKGQTNVKAAVNGAIKIFTVAVTIVVVAVPEGLPLAVTLTLAYSMRKMMADKALVRRLSACETMGSATTICSDKTGTLTLNQMTVVEAYIGGRKINHLENVELSPITASLLIEGIAHNTSGSVFEPEAGSEVHVHWKGAAEIVLASCTSWLDTDGSKKPMTSEADTFKKYIDNMAEVSLRCVAFAYRSFELEKVPDEEQRENWLLPEDDLILVAIVGIKDPCRPGVKEAVDLCTHAGVKVLMVTGDNLQTAKAIALECGILTDANASEPTLIEGRTFRMKTDAERNAIVEQITVMGRSSPSDKLLLVQALKRRDHVVAVTGDGTNDAPALHEADIGLSMGIQGTEVAKESSDIIILDDNFTSVVKVVRWGRSVYANIQKFIQFQLTVNVAALIINVVAAVSSGDVPLNAVQLLWVNLIMDTLGALALATEPPTDHLMDRPPVGRREPLITNIMWRNLTIQALYQVTVLLVLNFGGRSILHLRNDSRAHADKVKNTFIFNTFVLCQIFNEFNARKPDELNIFSGVIRNRLFIGIVGITTLLQVLIIEFLGKFTSTVRLNWKLWLVSIAIAFISWPLALLGKLLPVPKTPFGDYFSWCCTWCSKRDDGSLVKAGSNEQP